MQVEIEHAPATASIDGQRYWFCSDHCRERFTVEPRRFTRPTSPAAEPAAQDEALGPMSVDPVCGMTVKMSGAPHVTDPCWPAIRLLQPRMPRGVPGRSRPIHRRVSRRNAGR